MSRRTHEISRRYPAALDRYLVRPEERLLQQAYELGRKAIAGGVGLLEMARVHHRALAFRLWPTLSSGRQRGALEAAETFFMEMLSPFEAAHRGFRQANLRLQQLNEALERSNAELQQSEEHYRTLFNQACVMQEKLRNLSSKILHVQEAERKRISRELHDAVGQALTAINTNLAIVQRNGFSDPAALKQNLADSLALVAQTMDTVHGFARELRPAMLDELGLLPALRSYVQAFARRTGLSVRFDARTEAGRLDDEQKTVVFRVAQESLTNVAKHARASQVSVSLRQRGNLLQMQVKDNGRAFAVDRQLAAKGMTRLGLLGMQERVRLVNGRFTITSAPGRGTTVQVEIPLQTTETVEA